jgi:hypothetical protein
MIYLTDLMFGCQARLRAKTLKIKFKKNYHFINEAGERLNIIFCRVSDFKLGIMEWRNGNGYLCSEAIIKKFCVSIFKNMTGNNQDVWLDVRNIEWMEGNSYFPSK